MPIFGLLLTKTQFITQIPTPIAQTVRGLSLNCSNGLQKFPTIRFQVLGPDQTTPHGLNQLKHHKTLKQRGKTNRIKPLHHGVCQKLPKPVPTCSPRCVEPLCFLARSDPTPNTQNPREKLHILSLKIHHFCKLSSSSLTSRFLPKNGEEALLLSLTLPHVTL